MPLPQDSLIEYPCEFPIKVMGHAQDEFAQTVLEIVLHHAPDFDGAAMEMKTSRNGKYLSVTCTVQAISREQLDRLYGELSGHPMIVMVL